MTKEKNNWWDTILMGAFVLTWVVIVNIAIALIVLEEREQKIQCTKQIGNSF